MIAKNSTYKKVRVSNASSIIREFLVTQYCAMFTTAVEYFFMIMIIILFFKYTTVTETTGSP